MECCQAKIKVPSEKECQSLSVLKSIKERVRVIKKRLAALGSSNSDHDSALKDRLEKELASLKTKWNMWDQKRKIAAKERMVILGHEKNPNE